MKSLLHNPIKTQPKKSCHATALKTSHLSTKVLFHRKTQIQSTTHLKNHSVFPQKNNMISNRHLLSTFKTLSPLKTRNPKKFIFGQNQTQFSKRSFCSFEEDEEAPQKKPSRPRPGKKSVAVLGNGISGLSLVHFLKKESAQRGLDIDVTVFDRSKRAGGWLHSSYLKDPDTDSDFFFEKGPRSFRITSDTSIALDLVKELGLTERVVGASAASRSRFIFYKGKIQPVSFRGELFWKLVWPLFKEPWSPIRNNYDEQPDESIGSLIERKLGKYAADVLASAMISGIWAGDVYSLSLQHNLPFLYDIEKQHGSIIKGMARRPASKVARNPDKITDAVIQSGGIFSLRGGVQCLPNALKNQWLGDDSVSFMDAAVTRITHGSTGKLDLEYSHEGQHLTKGYDHIFSTLPANELSPMVSKFDSQLSKTLAQIPYVSMAVVQVAYAQENAVTHTFPGFGFLCSAKDKKPYLGVTFDSLVFPQLNEKTKESRFTVMIGGDPKIHENIPDPMKLSDDQLAQIAMDAISEALGITAKPSAMLVDRAENCLPQAYVGYRQNVVDPILNSTKKNIYNSNLSVGGAFMKGVSINDCMAYSQELAHHYVDQCFKS